MKKIIFIITILFILTGCSNNNNLYVIDFKESRIIDVISWSIENNVEDKITYEWVNNNDVTYGYVIDQSIEEGKPFKKMTVYLSKSDLGDVENGIETPNLIGKTLEEATKIIENSKFKVGKIAYKDSNQTKDTILSTTAYPGLLRKESTEINLTLSSGNLKTKSYKLDLTDYNDEDMLLRVYINGVQSYSKTSYLIKGTEYKIINFYGNEEINVKFRINKLNYIDATINFDE